MQKNFAVLRTPALPIEYLLLLNQQLAAHPGHFEEILQGCFSNDAFLEEAIYLASPQLYAQLKNWSAGKLAKKPKQTHKLAMTLYTYVCRMSSRATPFGLFASASFIGCAAATNLQIASRHTFKRHARVDMSCATKVGQEITQDSLIKRQLRYYPNSTLYQVESKFKYIEYSMQDNYLRSYRISSTEWTPYLEKVLLAARQGILLHDLCGLLVDEEVSEDEAMEYLLELEQAQLLVSELEPNVTGPEYYDRLLATLENTAGGQTWLEPLYAVKDLLGSQQVDVEKYLQAQGRLDQLIATEKSKHFVQVDLVTELGKSSISKEVVSYLEQNMASLLRIASPKLIPRFQRFKQKFLSRYETRSLPLLHALDPEIGIGYDVFTADMTTSIPLLENIRFSGNSTGTGSITWGKRENALVRKLTETLSQGRKVMTLTKVDVEDLNRYEGVVEGGVSVMGNLLATDEADPKSNDWKFNLKVISGNTGLNLVSRFCHGDRRLAEAAVDWASDEARGSEVIYAEVSHLPQVRHGNVLLRPQLRQYEIPIMANSACDPDYQIPLDDLYVSVEHNMVVLRSKRLGKRVIPRHTNAYNGEITNLPIFKFLYDLQQQESHFDLTAWTWGVLEEQPFLPRVEYGKFILSPAKWILRREAIRGIEHVAIPEQEAFFNNAYKQAALPQYVLIAEGDNELPIDTSNQISLKILIDKILKDGYVQVTEFLQLPENCLVVGPEGHHTNEVIIPLPSPLGMQGATPFQASVSFRDTPSIPALQRDFGPGSEWLYLKLYCGCGVADLVVREVLLPLVEGLKKEQLIEKWFFIRYNDPDDHLRVRFYNSRNPQELHQVLARLHARANALVQGGYIQKIQVDTYQREIERYGAQTMEACEKLFYHDSEAVFKLIALFETEGLVETYRWQAALMGVDRLLDDFGFGLDVKHQLAKAWSGAFFEEHGGRKNLMVQLDQSYRKQAKLIRAKLSGQDLSRHHTMILQILQERSRNLAPLVEQIKYQLATEDRLSGELVQSLSHMFLNRIFNTRQRQQELVIYHYLHKGYTAVKATDHMQVPA